MRFGQTPRRTKTELVSDGIPIAAPRGTPASERTSMFAGGDPQPLKTPMPIASDWTSRGVGIARATYG